MDHDDRPVGRILSRREALQLLSVGGATLLGVGTAGARTPVARANRTSPIMPSCVVRPEQTEGPYFIDAKLNRSDIRSEPSSGERKAGTPLALAFAVSAVGSDECRPLAGALVDVWHCDAHGVYSAFEDIIGGNFDTRGQTFLRGQQVTDDAGMARFTTIYPGWYAGRAVHIHFKIRTPADGGRTYEFTSQFYFDEDLNDRVHAVEPYAEHGKRATMNADDSIYRISGDQLLIEASQNDEGVAATFAIGLDLSDEEAGRSDRWG